MIEQYIEIPTWPVFNNQNRVYLGGVMPYADDPMRPRQTSPRARGGDRMTWDQKDQYKMENLNKVNSRGFMRVQICTTYKCQCVYSADHLSPTIRCIGGGVR